MQLCSGRVIGAMDAQKRGIQLSFGDLRTTDKGNLPGGGAGKMNLEREIGTSQEKCVVKLRRGRKSSPGRERRACIEAANGTQVEC